MRRFWSALWFVLSALVGIVGTLSLVFSLMGVFEGPKAHDDSSLMDLALLVVIFGAMFSITSAARSWQTHKSFRKNR
ncbi:MAG: hypothetical protein P4L74_06100 [Candidatus Doudnabacteria bacterium]|nr:hypothetical protein [Candidatus Doudnabacteria bacterium]